jgi:hypothetical protein
MAEPVLEAEYPGNPPAQLRAWIKDMAAHLTSGDERGCPLANATVELPDKDHPVRRVIEAFKIARRDCSFNYALRSGGRTVPTTRRCASDRTEHGLEGTG